MNTIDEQTTAELKYSKFLNMTIEKIVIDYGPDGLEYLGFGEYYNHNTKKFLRCSDGAMNRFGGDVM